MQAAYFAQSYDPTEWVCAGFWRRFLAVLIDMAAMVVISIPAVLMLLLMGVSKEDLQQGSLVTSVLQALIPFALHMLFWCVLGGTPGKLLLGLRIVDVKTGAFVRPPRAVLRYLGYIVSAIPLYLGYLWMLWDPRSQTWHDKFANTMVVRRA